MIAPRNSNNAQALDAFLIAKAQIETMLSRLKALSDDLFETHPDEVTWADVGTLNHYVSLLQQIAHSAFKEGEHADVPA